MGDTECVPKYNVGVIDTGIAISDPFGNST